MNNLITLEVTAATIISVCSLIVAIISFATSKKRADTTDTKELNTTLTRLTIEMESIKGIVMGNTPLREQVVMLNQEVAAIKEAVALLPQLMAQMEVLNKEMQINSKRIDSLMEKSK